MDDPISALDANTRKRVFEDVFQGLLKKKTRILVTHAVDFIHLADKIVIMDKGKIVSQGSYNELKSHSYIIKIKGIHDSNKEEINQA